MTNAFRACAAAAAAALLSTALPDTAAGSSDTAQRAKRTQVAEPLVGQIMVKLRNPAAAELVQPLGGNRVAALSASAGVGLKSVRPMSLGATVMALPTVMRLSEANAVIQRLAADPNVEWAAPDLHVRRFQAPPTPPDAGYATRQWNLMAPASMFSSAPVAQGGTAKTFTASGGANLPPAWAETQGANTVRVAIIDSGVAITHPDLAAAMLPGYDFVSPTALTGAPFNLPMNFVANDGDGRDADPTDPGDWVTGQEQAMYTAACDDPTVPNTEQINSSWHGTHMAGIVAAQWGAGGPAGTSNAGIAPNVRIIPVRAIGKCGGTSSDIIDAITWASGGTVAGVPNIANRAHVINLSLGTGGATCTQGYLDAINGAIGRGVTVVVATGNESANQVSTPANCPGVIAVTAHVINGDNADYANVGAQTAISAPGGGLQSTLAPNPAVASSDTAFYIWSTLLFGTTTPTSAGANNSTGPAIGGFTGTSPAAPHVSAVAALLLSLSPALPPATVKELIQTSARAHPAGGYCVTLGAGTCGAGLLDAGAAVTLHNQRRPTVTAADQTTTANGMVTLSSAVAAGGSGGTTFTYQWTQTAGRAVTLSSATAAQPTFTAPGVNGPLTFTVTATDNLNYRSSVVTKTVTVSGGIDAPAVTSQPQNATVNVGQTATFTVTATGTGPLTYQWSRNGTAINGATGTSFTTGATTAADNGATFTVTVTNAGGSATSNAATLTVNTPAPPPASGGDGGGGSLPLALLALLAGLAVPRRRSAAR